MELRPGSQRSQCGGERGVIPCPCSTSALEDSHVIKTLPFPLGLSILILLQKNSCRELQVGLSPYVAAGH